MKTEGWRRGDGKVRGKGKREGVNKGICNCG